MLTLNDGRDELWQWDTGRTLIVDPDCSQVHFRKNVFDRSIDVDVVNGVAIIPDVLLQTDKDLIVWAFSGTAENGYTKIRKTFKVNRRNKPADYVFTPPDQTSLEEIKEKIDYLESMQDPDAIKNAVNDYLEQNPVEAPVQSVNGKTGTVKLNAIDVGAISRDDLQEATNKVLAQAKESGEFDGADGAPGQDGITPTIGDNGNWYLGDTDTGKPSRGEEGPQGPRGPQGEPGHAGSDATVTAENIQSALGYTPADSEDVSAKLDKPATPPEVEKILKVTTVNNDGTFVCEWADAPSGGGAVDDVQVDGASVVADGVANIPLAKMGSTGVVKFDAFMPFTFNAGALRLANADENELTNPRYGFSTNRAITASNYRLAVELAMCDGKGAAWTDAEKTGAWKRLNSIKTTMDEIAVAGAQYYLGEQTAVSVVLPDDAEVGQMVTVSWYNSATAATLSITGMMLAFDYTPSANTRSEINALWDGTYWAVLGNEMEVPSDAETT